MSTARALRIDECHSPGLGLFALGGHRLHLVGSARAGTLDALDPHLRAQLVRTVEFMPTHVRRGFVREGRLDPSLVRYLVVDSRGAIRGESWLSVDAYGAFFDAGSGVFLAAMLDGVVFATDHDVECGLRTACRRLVCGAR